MSRPTPLRALAALSVVVCVTVAAGTTGTTFAVFVDGGTATGSVTAGTWEVAGNDAGSAAGNAPASDRASSVGSSGGETDGSQSSEGGGDERRTSGSLAGAAGNAPTGGLGGSGGDSENGSGDESDGGAGGDDESRDQWDGLKPDEDTSGRTPSTSVSAERGVTAAVSRSGRVGTGGGFHTAEGGDLR